VHRVRFRVRQQVDRALRQNRGEVVWRPQNQGEEVLSRFTIELGGLQAEDAIPFQGFRDVRFGVHEDVRHIEVVVVVLRVLEYEAECAACDVDSRPVRVQHVDPEQEGLPSFEIEA